MEKSFSLIKGFEDESLHENWEELLKKASLAGCEKGFEDPLKKDDEYKSLVIHKKLPESLLKYPPEWINKIETEGGTILEVFNDVDSFSDMEYRFKNLVFQSKEGFYFEMADLLPDNAYFVSGGNSSFASFVRNIINKKTQERYQERRYVVTYHTKSLSENGGIMSLFHEMGHLKHREKMSSELFRKYGDIMSRAQSVDPSKFIKEFSTDERALVLQMERDAWAWSIKTLRSLKERGIDLIPGWEKKEIKDWVDGDRLKTYEQGLHVNQECLRKTRVRRLNK